MKFVAQRVASAALCVSGELVSEIGRGLVVYLGVKAGDNEKQAEKAMEKVALFTRLRRRGGQDELIRPRRQGRGAARFAVHPLRRCQKGNRPSFSEAERPERADALYEHAVSYLRSLGVPVQTGVFGADMQIEQHNDGPVTIIFEC